MVLEPDPTELDTQITLFTVAAQVAASILEEFVVVPRAGPAPDDEATTRYARILNGIKEFVPDMVPFLGEVYQLALNYRRKTFAGRYKSAAWLMLLAFCLCQMKYLPWVVGELPAGEPFALSDLIYAAPLVAAVVQTIRYPDVKQTPEDEHTD